MTAPIVIHANCFVSRWSIKPGNRETFIEAFDALWKGAEEQMAQVTNFVFYGWGRNENEMVAIESWLSEEIVGAVRQSEGFITAVTHLLSLCEKPMQMEIYSPYEGARSVFDLYPQGDSKVHPVSGAINAVFN